MKVNYTSEECVTEACVAVQLKRGSNKGQELRNIIFDGGTCMQTLTNAHHISCTVGLEAYNTSTTKQVPSYHIPIVAGMHGIELT